jgi:hypothetical protein
MTYVTIQPVGERVHGGRRSEFWERRTAECDLGADVDERENSEEMHRTQPENLLVVAFIARALVFGLLADPGEALCVA